MSLLWAFKSISLCHFLASTILFLLLQLCSILHILKSGSIMPPALFFFKVALFVQNLLWCHTNLRLFKFYFIEKCYWNFETGCIESLDWLGSMGILIILILFIHEHEIPFHLFVSSSIPLIKMYSFR